MRITLHKTSTLMQTVNSVRSDLHRRTSLEKRSHQAVELANKIAGHGSAKTLDIASSRRVVLPMSAHGRFKRNSFGKLPSKPRFQKAALRGTGFCWQAPSGT